MAELRRPGARGQIPRHADPGQSQQALRHEGADPQSRRRGRLLRDPAELRQEHRDRLRPPRGLNRRLRRQPADGDRKSTRLNSSHSQISYAVFCLKKKKNKICVLSISVSASSAVDVRSIIMMIKFITALTEVLALSRR